MTPPLGPIQPHHAGSPSRVIQGFFTDGKPPIIQASPAPVTSVRRHAPTPIQAPPVDRSPRPATGPGQSPRPILPKSAVSSAVQPHAGESFALPPNFTLRPRGSGQPMPEPVQKKMEAFFNTSFTDVRVHVGNEAPSIGVLAFTHGTDLYFAPGQYNPHSTHGQQLLGHELTHVLQQCAGRVRNPLGSGVAVVQDPALEAEAERMGIQAATTPAAVQARFAASCAAPQALRGLSSMAALGPVSAPQPVRPGGSMPGSRRCCDSPQPADSLAAERDFGPLASGFAGPGVRSDEGGKRQLPDRCRCRRAAGWLRGGPRGAILRSK